MSTNITDELQEMLSADGGKLAKELAYGMIAKAKDGNASMAKLIFDRIDGPAQREEEPLSEEERVERITILLDRARERRDRQSGKRDTGRN